MSTTHTLANEKGRWVIRRANGSWVYRLRPEDRDFGEQLLTNLNGPEADH